jgi:hypothetical protein
MEAFWKPPRKPTPSAVLRRVVRVLVVARRADSHERAEALPVEVVEIVSESVLDRRGIHFRFGDGLGCPSPNREYRDRNCWSIKARGRFAALSRCRPHELDEKLSAHELGRGRAPCCWSERRSRGQPRPRWV